MTRLRVLAVLMLVAGCSKPASLDIAADPTVINKPGVTEKDVRPPPLARTCGSVAMNTGASLRHEEEGQT
jgi:hypothetical protein